MAIWLLRFAREGLAVRAVPKLAGWRAHSQPELISKSIPSDRKSIKVNCMVKSSQTGDMTYGVNRNISRTYNDTIVKPRPMTGWMWWFDLWV